MYIQNFSLKPEGGNHLEDQCPDERYIKITLHIPSLMNAVFWTNPNNRTLDSFSFFPRSYVDDQKSRVVAFVSQSSHLVTGRHLE
jgi:hypothetical protein